MIPYISNTPEDVKQMLKTIGIESIDDLFQDISEHQRPQSFDLPYGKSEFEVLDFITKIGRKNLQDIDLFLGGGYYDHFVPSAVGALISRGEFYTAYTPYQPECSQGTLQALYEFQSSICTLTGMEAANASLYDGGTALFEAIMMAIRIKKRNKIILDGGVNPIYRKMLDSYTTNLNIEFVETNVVHGRSDRPSMQDVLDDKTAAVIVQNPNFFGAMDDHSDIVEKTHAVGALVIQSVYPIALGLMKTPGEMGVDIVTGEGQSLGLPLNFGGPYLGFMATSKKHIRKMPGRIVGQTVDANGNTCYVNTLQAREQHIRREKATSNICTNVSLCALQSLVFMSLIGREGLKELAQTNFQKAEYLKKQLDQIDGVRVKRSAPTFNEFTIELPCNASDIAEKMIEQGIAAGFPLGQYYPEMKNYMIVAVTEKRTKEQMDRYAEVLKTVLKDKVVIPAKAGI